MLRRFRQLASDSAVYGLSGILAKFISIWLVPLYTRAFTPEDYGVMSLVGSTLGLLSMLVVLGMDNSAHRWYYDTEDEVDRKRTIATWMWTIFTVGTVWMVALLAASDVLATRIVERADSAVYFRLLALTLPLGTFYLVANGRLRMERLAWRVMSLALGYSLLLIVLSAALVLGLRMGLLGGIIAQVVACVAGAVASIVLLGSWIHPRYFELARLRAMFWYSLPLVPAGVSYWVVNTSDRYFVQLYDTTAEVGLYAVGSALAAAVVLATGAFQQAWGPYALSIHKDEGAREFYANVFLAYCAVGGFACAGLALFAPEIILLFAPATYVGAATIVGLLSLSYLLIGLTYIAAVGPAIARSTKPVGYSMMFAAALNIALNYALVPRYGKVGSAAATMLAQSVVPVYVFWRSQRLYPIPYRFGAGGAMLGLALAVMALGLLVPGHSTAPAVGAKLLLLLTFVPAAFALRVVTVADTQRLVGLLRGAASGAAR